MDVLDAGVYVSKWTAHVPKHTQVTMWGPLAAKQMGLEGWETQDGGETGFIMHHTGAKLPAGRGTSTLIFVRRLEKAFLTVYLGGYPADAAPQQRRADTMAAVGACELFLGRLAKVPVQFTFEGEMSLVDNLESGIIDTHARSDGKASGGQAPRALPGGLANVLDDGHNLGGGKTTGKRIGNKPLGGKTKIEEA